MIILQYLFWLLFSEKAEMQEINGFFKLSSPF